jgi:hypothetical protein
MYTLLFRGIMIMRMMKFCIYPHRRRVFCRLLNASAFIFHSFDDLYYEFTFKKLKAWLGSNFCSRAIAVSEYIGQIRPSRHVPICKRLVTLDTSQFPSCWLKDVAKTNMVAMDVTLDTSQFPSGWLKDVAPLNMKYRFVTLDTFVQSASGWLKDDAAWNMIAMLVTPDTFHSPIGWF